MSTKLLPAAIILTCALGQAACSDDINTANPIEPTPNPVTETFTGTLTPNGAKTEPFTVTRSGVVTAALASLAPNAGVTVGLSLGIWNGTASSCQTIISNDIATVGTTIVGTAERDGRLCVRVYDAAGTLPQATNYEVTVVRP
jgi:hypothetical protein